LEIFVKSDDVEEIMLQVSTLATSTKPNGDERVKVPFREGSLRRPTPTFSSDGGFLCINGMLPVVYELLAKKAS